jgi:hypothetical protein
MLGSAHLEEPKVLLIAGLGSFLLPRFFTLER